MVLWTEDPFVLIEKDTLREFVPMPHMSQVEKINALMRFTILISSVLFIIKGDVTVFIIPFTIAMFIYILTSWKKFDFGLKESFSSNKDDQDVRCVEPNFHNPFMNVLISDSRERGPACSDTNTKDKIENAFNFNLYKDENDVFGNRNSQRQFYTMPSTSTPNMQNDFANWLYKTGPILKETTIDSSKNLQH